MKSSADASADFIRAFSELSQRLADVGICTHTLEAHHSSFGHWRLIATKRSEAVRFTYDGRDSFIRVETSPIRDHSAPNGWEEAVVKGLENMNNEGIDFAENFLKNRFNT